MREYSWLNRKKVCITGATGFLGGHLLPLLQEAGCEITCIVRSQASAKRLPAGIRSVLCDFSTGNGLEEALGGQDILVHMAALLFGIGWQAYLHANVCACETIVRCLRRINYSPERIVHVSSLAAAGPCAIAPGRSESEPASPVSAYGWSKLLCERTLYLAPSQSIIIVRPPIIYGSGDRGLLPLFRAAQKGFGTSPGFRREFPVSVIHARDAAKAILYACKPNASGIYHLSDGELLNMAIFCKAMGRALGKDSLRVLHIPLPIMGISAAICAGWGLAWGKFCAAAGREAPRPPQWNPDKFREAEQAGWLADSTRIRNELDFMPLMDLEHGMAEAVAGYRARGWL